MAKKKEAVKEVLEHPELLKNVETGTITYKNSSAVNGRLALKEKLKSDKEEIDSLKSRLSQLEELINKLVETNKNL